MKQGLMTHVLEWLRADPSLSLDSAAQKLADVSPRAAPSRADAIHSAKEHVKQLYRSLHDQGLLGESTFAALRTFAESGASELELAREMRPKNAYNLVRLLTLATSWLREGHPTFEATGAARDELLAIKRGETPLDRVLERAEALVPELEAAKNASPLPERADIARVDRLTRRIAEEAARRYVNREPGPLGQDAPPFTEASWAE